MSVFGGSAQGSVSGGLPSGLVPGSGSGGSVPKSARPHGRRLLVSAVVLVSVLVVAAVVVLLFVLGVFGPRSGSSLANGLKVSLNKLVVIQVEGDDEDVAVSRPYSVFLPGGDLAVFAPAGEKVYYNVVRQDTGSQVSPGKAKITWPEDADESGGALEPCESGQRYVLEDNTVTCAKVDAPKMADKKMGFGQVLYSGKDLQIVASPSVDNAKALSGFSPDGKLLWSKELATPGQVSLDGSNIIVTSFEDSQVSIEGYGAVEESQKPSESPTLVEAAKGPDKDAIKDFDYKNSFVPDTTYADISDCAHFFKNEGSPVFNKIPDTNDGCWLTMVEGESQEKIEEEDDFGIDPYVGLPWVQLDSPGSHPEYADINLDGYTDFLVMGNIPDALETLAYVFDPTDPEHPYVAVLGEYQDPGYEPKYLGHGKFEAAGMLVGDERCVTRRFRIENDADGVPRVVGYETTEDVANNTDSGCL